ncbi:hypothetical protein [Streptomyces sp. CA-111067]|uniref:hypothetical protein n=1 Tax=Streptomyces sp. CA-111067 TaxID=3240046 RepID=UPI003D97C829
MSAAPTLRVLSLGAGVQSTRLLLLAAEGRLPKLDAAIFADTGWEPRAVYEHLDRIEREVAQPADIPTPAGPTPKELGTESAFIPLTQLTGTISRERDS